MFLVQRPAPAAIDRFLRESSDLALSYGPVGILGTGPPARGVTEVAAAIGRGGADFERARAALVSWQQFDLGWVEVFPRQAPIAVGTVVAVLIRHLGFWSLNGCRVVYLTGGRDEQRFGFAYGTLPNHAEAGEELFEVFVDPQTGGVMYRIRATSWAHASLARLGRPIVRLLQARFRRNSVAAMRRAMSDQTRTAPQASQ